MEESIRRPISPPKASISRTIFPFATPPIEGLQLILAMESTDCVIRTVFSPILAQARLASVPACPPPITATSKLSKKAIKKLYKNRDCLSSKNADVKLPANSGEVPVFL